MGMQLVNKVLGCSWPYATSDVSIVQGNNLLVVLMTGTRIHIMIEKNNIWIIMPLIAEGRLMGELR
jgi:hypothetical protein